LCRTRGRLGSATFDRVWAHSGPAQSSAPKMATGKADPAAKPMKEIVPDSTIVMLWPPRIDPFECWPELYGSPLLIDRGHGCGENLDAFARRWCPRPGTVSIRKIEDSSGCPPDAWPA
jgi:hypothetical protein